MCIDNDYLLIFSMLFFESANVIDAVCIFLRKYLKNMRLKSYQFVFSPSLKKEKNGTDAWGYALPVLRFWAYLDLL